MADNEAPVVNGSNENRIRQSQTGLHLRYIRSSCALVIVPFIGIAAFPKQ